MARHHLRTLRSSRVDPPGRASDDLLRRSIYGAALQQFEDLVLAAKKVGPASSPLLLFYALSQAGRAVVAAHGDQPEIRGHGLSECRSDEVSDVLHQRFDPTPKKDGTDAFGAVARATGSPTLQSAVELGAVWAALPQTYHLPAECWRPDWRVALDVGFDKPFSYDEGVHIAVASFGGNPLLSWHESLADGRYPTIPQATKVSLRGGAEVEAGGWIADLYVPEIGNAQAVLERLAPTSYDGECRALVPLLPGHAELLSPLMLWWVLLFGLSIIARYHPAPWAAALDVERSRLAVPLEATLSTARRLLPVLIYEAIFFPDFQPPN